MTIQDTWEFATESVVHALGEEVTYTREGSGPVTVEAVFGSGFQRVSSGEIRVSSNQPELDVSFSAFEWGMEPGDVRGDTVTVRGMAFTVVNSRPLVEGVGATLVLKRA